MTVATTAPFAGSAEAAGSPALPLPVKVASAALLGATLVSGSVGLSLGLTAIGAVAGVLVPRRPSRLRHVVLLLLALRVVFGLLTGGGPSGPSTAVEFLSSEGSEFAAFLPAVLLVGVRADRTLASRWVDRLFLFALCTGIGLWLIGAVGLRTTGQLFTGLGSSHHATGLLFGVVCVWFSIRVQDRTSALSSRAGLIAAGAAGFLVLESGSRASLGALLIVAMVIAVRNRRPGRMGIAVAGVVLLGAIALTVSDRATATAAFVAEFEPTAIGELTVVDGVDGRIAVVPSGQSTEGRNLLVRFAIWQEALEQASRSPIVGIGSWKLNDLQAREFYVLGNRFLIGGARVHRGLGAHSLLLQYLAENGAVGISLFVWMVVLMRRALARIPPGQRSLGTALVVYMLGTQIASNALMSPTLAFAFWVAFALVATSTSTTNMRAPA